MHILSSLAENSWNYCALLQSPNRTGYFNLIADGFNLNGNKFLPLSRCSRLSSAQPTARSTPIHHTQPCRTQPSSQLRNGAKHHGHTRTPHTHCPHHTHTPHTHALQSNGVRNGGLNVHPKLGSLPRGSSSTSSSSSTGPRHSKKLQSNPSITSQSSKRSKSSSKSNSSQIPTEAQDGEAQNPSYHHFTSILIA